MPTRIGPDGSLTFEVPPEGHGSTGYRNKPAIRVWVLYDAICASGYFRQGSVEVEVPSLVYLTESAEFAEFLLKLGHKIEQAAFKVRITQVIVLS